jgi:sugar (pentulose or hexulose) kinase
MFSSGLMTLEIAERSVLDRLKSAVIGPTTRVGRLSAYFIAKLRMVSQPPVATCLLDGAAARGSFASSPFSA